MEELDTETVRAAARGERQGFRSFYRHYAPMVWRVALRTLGGDEAAATQVTQDVFVRAHASLRKFNFHSAPSTWLYRIAWNRCMSAVSKQRRWWSRMLPLRDMAGPDDGSRIEARDAAQRILSALAPQERFLLIAREVEGMSFEELAESTGIAAGALRTRLSRLKQRIRQGDAQ